MATTWENQYKEAGASWLAGQAGINAGSTSNEYGQVVYAGQVGEATTWDYQTKS